ncbi:MAG: hypothetical protein C0497_03505 [Gemmatimonas sp.]|nr:hypothetical protein [Gemmatimonas sp.]
MRDALRAVRQAGAAEAASEPPLELRLVAPEPPRLQRAEPLEGDAVRVRRVPGDPVVGIAAFLDGIQESRVIAHWPGGIPLVHGTVAAAVRLRRSRTLVAWRSDSVRVERALFVPRAAVGEAAWDALGAECDVRDTLARGEEGPWHPQEFTARALSAVQRRRESAETVCAELWCAEGDGPLFVDGGIAAVGAAAHSTRAIGVVKSHRTLYVDGDALPVVLALAAGERTTAFTVTSPRRAPVASWYLRLREPAAHDALWGLVRVEAALDGATAERADLVSRWLLAERAPVSLPDPRWGAMAYGVRLTEEYLRAVTR